jgi:guanyl-specific ribonuclease Sa
VCYSQGVSLSIFDYKAMGFLRKKLSFLLACLVCFSVVITDGFNFTKSQSVIAQETTIVALIPTINLSQLPPEAHKTLKLIDQGGPFPYPQKDGTIFYNRERLLPIKPSGYYREYTIPTPGINHRGSRRFVTGKQTEIYYTNNHYQSFFRVLRQ